MIQEYRKRTAIMIIEDSGFRHTFKEHSDGDIYINWHDSNPELWHPDLDANQMEMVEDKLIDCGFELDFTADGKTGWDLELWGIDSEGDWENLVSVYASKNQRTVLMEAFMQIPEELLKSK